MVNATQKELQKKVLLAFKDLKKRAEQNNATTDVSELQKDLKTILRTLSERTATQLLTKIEKNVTVDNLEGALNAVVKAIEKNKTVIPKSIEVIQKQKPEWYKDPVEKMEVEGNVKADIDWSTFSGIIGAAFGGLFSFLTQLQKKTSVVMPADQHYTTPQTFVLVDPNNGFRPFDLKKLSQSGSNVSQTFYGGGRGEVGIKSANAINDGTLTITTAGTRQQLPNIRCSRIFIQSHPSNTGDIVVGGANVIASESTRRGLALFSSQWQEFQVDNLSRLYVDSTASGDKINYIYEYTAS